MNTILSIGKPEDFDSMIKQAPLVIVTSYRGSWCPFCRSYLRKFDEARIRFPNNSLLIGVSVDTVDECKNLKIKLDLGFDLISDENLILSKLLNVATGKGHGKEAYLQPSVFIFTDEQKTFEWIQKPILMNLGGAIDRIPINEVIQNVQRLSNEIT